MGSARPADNRAPLVRKPALAEDRFRGLIDAAPDAMVCVDAGGRITLANAQTERLFGYGRAELEGQLVELLVPEGVRAVHPARRAGYTADPVPRPMGAGMQLAGRRRDGSTFPAEISLSAIETEDGTLVMAAVRDVTRQRQQREELERAYRNMESFAYSVAHDLRTPLRALAGFSAALMEDYADALGEVGHGYAKRIEIASEQMSALIDDLLHLSRVSRAEIKPEPVDLGAEAVSITGSLQRDDSGRRVRLAVQQPVWVQADRILVGTLLRNLLGNAWKFTSGQDDPSIEFGTVSAAEDARVCCFIRDNGAGFDSAYVHKLFRPFQRLHTTSEFPGTGVGLASARQIVERHGGRMWAEGAVGEGATFYFTLPATQTARRDRLP
jgi:PAS domain S-box-containing protein